MQRCNVRRSKLLATSVVDSKFQNENVQRISNALQPQAELHTLAREEQAVPAGYNDVGCF